MLKVAIVGASGYTGVELLRILHCHPEAAVTCVTSERSAGKRISDIYPGLKGRCDLLLENLEPVRVAGKADFIFTALPHKAAMEVAPTFLSLGKRMVDLSADYRPAGSPGIRKMVRAPSESGASEEGGLWSAGTEAGADRRC